MPVPSLQQGVITNILQNVIHALPSRRARLQTSAAVEFCTTSSGAFAALAGANTTGVETVGGFIRCTTGACDVIVGV